MRGEDSFVRAQWAAAPLLWQIYPQHAGVHAIKLDAFIDRYLQPLAPGPAASVRQLMLHWNGLAPAPALPLGVADWQAWQEGHLTWRKALAMQDDLCSQLQRFVQLRRGAAC